MQGQQFDRVIKRLIARLMKGVSREWDELGGRRMAGQGLQSVVREAGVD